MKVHGILHLDVLLNLLSMYDKQKEDCSVRGFNKLLCHELVENIHGMGVSNVAAFNTVIIKN